MILCIQALNSIASESTIETTIYYRLKYETMTEQAIRNHFKYLTSRDPHMPAYLLEFDLDVLIVLDNGKGFNPNKLRSIFQKTRYVYENNKHSIEVEIEDIDLFIQALNDAISPDSYVR